MRTLYGFSLSANTHRVRLLLSAMQLAYKEISINIPAGEHKGAAFLELNPLGQVPVLVEDGFVLRDSHTIMIYLAEANDSPLWARAPKERAAILQWLFFSANELQNSVHMARLHFLLGIPMDIAAVQQSALASLRALNSHLATSEWLALGRPTIADLSCYPIVAVSGDAELSLAGLPHVSAWLERVQKLPGHVPMPGALAVA